MNKSNKFIVGPFFRLLMDHLEPFFFQSYYFLINILNFEGYVVDSLDVIYKSVKRNEFLANILDDHNISYDAINTVAERAKGVFDMDSIQIWNHALLLPYETNLHLAVHLLKEL